LNLQKAETREEDAKARNATKDKATDALAISMNLSSKRTIDKL